MKYTTLLAALAASALAAPDVLHFAPGPQIHLRGLLGAEYAGLTAVRCYVGAGDAPAWSCDADLAPGYSLVNATVVRDGACVEAKVVPDEPTFADAKHALDALRVATHGMTPHDPVRMTQLMAIDPAEALRGLEDVFQDYLHTVDPPMQAFRAAFAAAVDEGGAGLPSALREALKAHPVESYRAMVEANKLSEKLEAVKRDMPSTQSVIMSACTAAFCAVMLFIEATLLLTRGWYIRRQMSRNPWYLNPVYAVPAVFIACYLALAAFLYADVLAQLDVGYVLGYVVAAPMSLFVRAFMAFLRIVNTTVDGVFGGAEAGFQAFLGGVQ